MNTKTYTEEDIPNAILYGFSHLLPMEIPFVELKRGQKEFQIEETTHRIEKSQGGKWEVWLVSGQDDFDIAGIFTFSSKEYLVEMINQRLSFNFMMNQEGKVKPPQSFNLHEVQCVVDRYKATKDSGKDIYIAFLESVISFMEHEGCNKWQAEVKSAGFTQLENQFMSVIFLKTEYVKKIEGLKMSLAIDKCLEVEREMSA